MSKEKLPRIDLNKNTITSYDGRKTMDNLLSPRKLRSLRAEILFAKRLRNLGYLPTWISTDWADTGENELFLPDCILPDRRIKQPDLLLRLPATATIAVDVTIRRSRHFPLTPMGAYLFFNSELEALERWQTYVGIPVWLALSSDNKRWQIIDLDSLLSLKNQLDIVFELEGLICYFQAIRIPCNLLADFPFFSVRPDFGSELFEATARAHLTYLRMLKKQHSIIKEQHNTENIDELYGLFKNSPVERYILYKELEHIVGADIV
ncbi:hypothetical protein WKV44_08755 [Spirochaetia bacterium 38H-sp]|uniref:Uncharacterized protein n=1 Tax=Rarispira pelagica TaxID=3141764 RepID=A0ABU9UDW1_9SPIR